MGRLHLTLGVSAAARPLSRMHLPLGVSAAARPLSRMHLPLGLSTTRRTFAAGASFVPAPPHAAGSGHNESRDHTCAERNYHFHLVHELLPFCRVCGCV